MAGGNAGYLYLWGNENKTKNKPSQKCTLRLPDIGRTRVGKKQWHKLWFIPLAILLFALLVVGYAYRQVAYVPAVIGNDTTQLYVKDGFSLEMLPLNNWPKRPCYAILA